MKCDRVDFEGGRGLCLGQDNQGLFASTVGIIFDQDFKTLHRVALEGYSSRTRVSPDGRYGAVTTFISGDSYAQVGFSTRTLVIDSDFHVRHLTSAMAPNAREGLLEALQSPTKLPWLVSKRERSEVHVLPCVVPTRIPNSADLLGSPAMAQLLAVARKSYDCIIVEIAPVMSVVDIKMIERYVDQFVFVVAWGETKRDIVVDALSDAEIIRDRVAGIVLNKADPVALKTIDSLSGIKPGAYTTDASFMREYGMELIGPPLVLE